MYPPRRPPIPRRPSLNRAPGSGPPGSGNHVPVLLVTVVAVLVVIGGVVGVSQMSNNTQDGGVVAPTTDRAGKRAPVDSVPDLTPVGTDGGTSASTVVPPPVTTGTGSVAPVPVPTPVPVSTASPVPPTVPEPAAPAPAAVSPTAAPGASAQDVIARVKGSIVLILADKNGGTNTGTGFVISPNMVATCNHVIDGTSGIMLFNSSGKRLTVKQVVAQDRTADLAVIECGPGLPPPMPIGDSDQVRDGDEIAVTGFPVVGKFDQLGFQPAVSTTRGTVSARRLRQVGDNQRVEVLQIDAAINPGNSGGPVYSVRDGTVLAIASSKLVEEQGIGFAVTVNALRHLIGQ